MQQFTNEQIEILRKADLIRDTFIKDADQSAGFKVQKFTIDLTTAAAEFNPRIIGFPFQSIVFENASADSVNIYCKFNSNDQGVAKLTYSDNASVTTDRMFSKAFLSWDAQPGQSIDVIVYVDSKYFSGSLKNSGTVVVAGGVTINEGTAFTDGLVALGAATQTLIFAQNNNRAVSVCQNDTGASIWVGDSAVTNSGANIGEEIPAGSSFEWRNTAALYAYSVAGGNLFTRNQTI